MSLDKPPEPFSGDYYVQVQDVSVRGAVVHSGHSLSAMSIESQTAVKIPQSFTSDADALPFPKDPLYVLPKSRFVVPSQTPIAHLGNLIVAGFQAVCPNGTEIVTDVARMRISVNIPGTLDFKVKFFKDEDDQRIVAVRRDCGDWFAFIQIYSAIKKFLREQGVQIETIGF